MTTSTTARRHAKTLSVGKQFILGVFGIAMVAGIAFGVTRFDWGKTESDASASSALSWSLTPPSVYYVVDSLEEAQAIQAWHVSDPSTMAIPYEVMIAATVEDDEAVNAKLREMLLFDLSSGEPAVSVQDLRDR